MFYSYKRIYIKWFVTFYKKDGGSICRTKVFIFEGDKRSQYDINLNWLKVMEVLFMGIMISNDGSGKAVEKVFEWRKSGGALRAGWIDMQETYL